MSNMNESNLSAAQILKATLFAFLIAAIVAIIAVFPAQYGKDFTGLGEKLGFSRLYQKHSEEAPKTAPTFPLLTLEDVGSEAKVAKPKEALKPAPAKQYAPQMDSLKVTIPAGKGLEKKILVLKHGQVKYAWKTDKRATVFVDFHGDVKEDAVKNSGYYESYAVAYANNMAGSFVAPFEGKHGWYFKNKTAENVDITIYVQGEYQLVKE